jgi:hypothetical protein
MNEQMGARLIVVETVGSVCWFLMDASWMFGIPLSAKLFAVFTIFASLLVFRYTERVASQMLVTAAMAAWASMNVCWMLNDLKIWDGGVTVASAFFAIGAICLGAAVVTAKRSMEPIQSIIARFRRLRVHGSKRNGTDHKK